MKDSVKAVYRFLLFEALLRVKGTSWMREPEPVESLTPWAFSKNFRALAEAKAVANVMADLAYASCTDFQFFDEARFWQHCDALDRAYPKPIGFRRTFDLKMLEAETDFRDPSEIQAEERQQSIL
jgi:hypothetical protein